MCERQEGRVRESRTRDHEHEITTVRGGERKMIWTILAVIGLIAVLVWLF
jgi:hypothetical protein